MSSMASCPTQRCRSSLAMRSSAGSMRLGPASKGSAWGSVWASHGSATPAASAPIAWAARKIYAISRSSPATRATVAFATATIADARYAFSLGEAGSDVALAPLLCAGLIGWRSLVIAGDGKKLGLYGFGAAAHIVAQVAKWQGRTVFAFTRPGDVAAQTFARELGAIWAGGSDEMPPEPLDAAIIYTTVGDLVPLALQAVRNGGRVACAGIHMSDIPPDLLRKMHAYWRASNYISVGQIYLQDNPLLESPLRLEHIKPRLLGHWGTTPGIELSLRPS